jgi:hypothetical protein
VLFLVITLPFSFFKYFKNKFPNSSFITTVSKYCNVNNVAYLTQKVKAGKNRVIYRWESVTLEKFFNLIVNAYLTVSYFYCWLLWPVCKNFLPVYIVIVKRYLSRNLWVVVFINKVAAIRKTTQCFKIIRLKIKATCKWKACYVLSICAFKIFKKNLFQ